MIKLNGKSTTLMGDSAYPVIHNFEWNGGVYYFFNGPAQVDVECHKCGMVFDIGSIVEPNSENPCLALHSVVGMNAVERVIQEWRRYKQSQ